MRYSCLNVYFHENYVIEKSLHIRRQSKTDRVRRLVYLSSTPLAVRDANDGAVANPPRIAKGGKTNY